MVTYRIDGLAAIKKLQYSDCFLKQEYRIVRQKKMF